MLVKGVTGKHLSKKVLMLAHCRSCMYYTLQVHTIYCQASTQSFSMWISSNIIHGFLHTDITPLHPFKVTFFNRQVNVIPFSFSIITAMSWFHCPNFPKISCGRDTGAIDQFVVTTRQLNVDHIKSSLKAHYIFCQRSFALSNKVYPLNVYSF